MVTGSGRISTFGGYPNDILGNFRPKISLFSNPPPRSFDAPRNFEQLYMYSILGFSNYVVKFQYVVAKFSFVSKLFSRPGR